MQLIFLPRGIHFFFAHRLQNTYIFLWKKLIICQVQLPLISGSYLISLLISTFHTSIFYFPDLNSFLFFSKVPNLTMILYSVKDFFFQWEVISMDPWDHETTDPNSCPSVLANFVFCVCVCVCEREREREREKERERERESKTGER